MTSRLDITLEQQDLLLRLLQQFLPNVCVWAFGSRIKGCARSTSDLDLAVFAAQSQKSQVFALQEALEESNLPFRVDLLVWDEIPDNFKSNIQAHFVPLVDGKEERTIP